MNDDLVRAIKTETPAALIYWFGVGCVLVWRWRKVMGNRVRHPRWTKAEIALLGTATDEVIGKRIGRSRQAVLSKRCKKGIPTFYDRRHDNLGAATPRSGDAPIKRPA